MIVENGEEVYSHPAESSAPTGINHSDSESLHVVVGVSATFPLPRIIGRVDGLKLNVEGQCRHLDCLYRERKAIGWIVTHRWTPGSGSRYPGFQVWTVGELKVESVLKCDRNGDIVWSGRPNQMMYSFTV